MSGDSGRIKVSAHNRRLRKLHRERFGLLKEWYGSEFAATEVSAHVSTPVSLGEGVRKLMARLESPEARILRILRKDWAETAGPAISKLAEPLSWKDGTLTVEVRHSALLMELKPSLEFLKKAVNAKLADAECAEIKLVIAGGGRPRPRSRRG